MEQTTLLQNIVKILDEKKAAELRVLKIDEVTSLADYFVICNGNSTTHVKSLADECEAAIEKTGVRVLHREGMGTGSWILLDYGDIIVHIYNKETRNYYNLEHVWKDGEELSVDTILS